MHQDRDAVIVGGVRTPFVRAGTLFRELPAVELGRIAVREAVERAEVDPDAIDEVVVGNVAGSSDAANVARVIALLAKLPRRIPAVTVNRNCASGLDAVVEAARRIRAGEADLVVAAAAESMSTIPFLWSAEARSAWIAAMRSRRLGRLGAAVRFRPRHFRPVPALELGLTDPVSGLSMGQTAERLAKEFDIPREEQDEFALRSHRRAAEAWSSGRLAAEVVAVPVPPRYDDAAERDTGIREEATLESLAALRPVFDRGYGTVTAGNASQITDGAVALVMASASRARALGLSPLGSVRSWGFAGCDPARMGLGPVFAIPQALKRAGGVLLDRIDLVEINEAFAAQVLACLKALSSRAFCEEQLGSGPVGAPAPDRLNVNGGAIALGHPVGASGARLVLTLLREMARRDAALGLAALCVGGGQGAAMVLERA